MQIAPWRDNLASFLLGPAPARALPARVLDQIAHQQRRGEILIGWMQAVVLAVFAALYHVSPEPLLVDVPFDPVPWALGLYAAFTAIRLIAAHRDRLPFWFVALSVLADVALLMVTIWSFHLQYASVPSFYLKAPALLYVFIFIALRALCYDPRPVVLAGIAGAAGWLVLLGYALAKATPDVITADYFEYMTSYKILPGAEIDKVMSILIVTGLITLAMLRSRRLLARAVADSTAAMELSRFFAPEVAREIAGAAMAIRPGDGVEREAAAMFVDLRGFTRLAGTMAPKALVELLGEYQRRVIAIVQAHRGTINTFLGDGIMITFGATRPSTAYAADALRCAAALIDDLGAWSAARRDQGFAAPGIGIGVAHGPMICGAIGDESRLEYATIGDAVNRAAKLQNQTKAEGVVALTTAATRDLAAAQGYDGGRAGETRPARTVAGVAEPVDLVVIR
ncbi:adenylate/guanylate cyclase domain-containing protein [Desertibaculum subflavum]|uniref:adenylate/guanylate cyclase domain-containing protein n=1 Tax=Desertibaculum subflavum TaxID=2268458 RepID=UPI000E6712E3